MNLFRNGHGRLCAILAVAALTGCREITTTTQILPNGSCIRTVQIRSDSTAVDSVFTGPFTIPVDSTWTVSRKKEKDGEKKFIYNAERKFHRVSDLNLAYSQKDGRSPRVSIDIQLKRRFRWFNTFYEYRETYKACTPFTRVPISDFLTQQEQSLYYIKNDTLGLDKKVDQWLLKSYFEEFFDTVATCAESTPVKNLSPEVVRGRKQELFEAFKSFEQKSNDFDIQKTLRFLEGFYRNKGVAAWSDRLDTAMKGIFKKQEFLMDLDSDSYVNRVIMPGLILDTNASSVEGMTVEWKLKSSRFCWEDYVMRVESRVVNRWAIWVTAALLLAVLAALAVSLIRRK